MKYQAIRPGNFGNIVAVDARRLELDRKNDTVLAMGDRPDIVFIGDSITEFWELPVFFSGDGLYLINRGIGYDEMKYISRRFQADVLQFKPRCCVLLGGINDSWGLEGDPMTHLKGETMDSLVERVKQYFSEVFHMACQAELSLAIGSILPVDMPYRECDELRNEYILCINQFIKQVCKDRNFLYVDYHSAMCDSSGKRMRPGLTYEGLHPNADGYKIMRDVLREQLKSWKIEL